MMNKVLFVIELFLHNYFIKLMIIVMFVLFLYQLLRQVILKDYNVSKRLKVFFIVSFTSLMFILITSSYAYNYIFRQELKNLGNDYNVYIENKLFDRPKEFAYVLKNIRNVDRGHITGKCIDIKILYKKNKIIKSKMCYSEDKREAYEVDVQEMMGKKFHATVGTIVQDGSYPVLDEIFPSFPTSSLGMHTNQLSKSK